MNQLSASAFAPEVLMRALQHGEARRAAIQPRSEVHSPEAFTIAISREVGARGTSVGREIGQRLGWPVFDQELVQAVADKMHVGRDVLESVDERHKDWLQERMEALCAVPTVSETAFVGRLMQILLSLASHGQCVIVGRGAPHVLPPSTTLRLRLVADLEDRVQFISRERDLSHRDAARHVYELDRLRLRFVRDHFQADAADPRNYDLVINTSRWTIHECGELAVAALERLQSHARKQS